MRIAILLALLTACESKPPSSSGSSQGAPSGLPSGEAPPSTPATDPHAGVDMGAGANPHAGIDMGAGANPHGGMTPEGGRAQPVEFDPTMVLEGTIDVAPKLKAQVKAGDIMFVSVKTVDASGTPQRIPIAVDRVDVATLPAPFALSGKNTMMPGTKFEGNVMVSVRIDRDGEATTRAKGDIEGNVKATIPAKGLKIVLDTPVP